MKKLENYFFGITWDVLKAKNTAQAKSAFFKPYTSVGDFAARAVSVVGAPVFSAITSVVYAVLVMYRTVSSLWYLATGNKTKTDDAIKCMHHSEKGFSAFLVFGLLSPIINLVDLLGSLVATATAASKERQVAPATAAA